MANKTITLYVDETSIRLMVISGNKIKEWADLPLESSIVQGNLVVNEAEVAAKIKQLFQALKIKSRKVLLGVSGLYCLTRPITLPQLPKVMLNEAVRREARRVLPVSLEQLYISWQSIPAPEGKTRVFLVAIPCKAADALFKALNQAGVEASFISIKPLLLARAVKEATAIIVDVQTKEFDIVVMVDNIPQPVRTVRFANEQLSWEEKLIIIKNELDRTITFYNSNNLENTLDSSTPIFACGELASDPELCDSLSGELGYPVLPLSSPLECLGGFAPSRYMANISLGLRKRISSNGTARSFINLNLLPAPYQKKSVSMANVFAVIGAVFAISLIAYLVMLIQGSYPDIAQLRNQLNTRTQLMGDITKLQQKVNDVEASRDDFAAALGSIQAQSNTINGNLGLILSSLSSGMGVSSINHADDMLTISGTAPTENEVLSYFRSLDASGKFGEISIMGMSKTGGVMAFTLSARVETEASGTSGVEVALSSLPGTVSLTGVSYTNGALTIGGNAPSEDEVLSYLRSLEASGKFSEIRVSNMAKAKDGGMEFSVVLKV